MSLRLAGGRSRQGDVAGHAERGCHGTAASRRRGAGRQPAVRVLPARGGPRAARGGRRSSRGCRRRSRNADCRRARGRTGRGPRSGQGRGARSAAPSLESARLRGATGRAGAAPQRAGGRALAPGAALLSPRGKVLEHGLPRYPIRTTAWICCRPGSVCPQRRAQGGRDSRRLVGQARHVARLDHIGPLLGQLHR